MQTLTRPIVVLSLAISLITLPVFAAPVQVQSVMPLHNQAGQNFCTAWHINEKSDLWATAGHCVAAAYKQGWRIMISGKPAELIYIGFDEQRDVAVLEVKGLRAKAFKLAKQSVARGDKVIVDGYPYGLPVMVRVFGTMAARMVPIGSTSPVSDILDVVVAGGSSGSPVLNAQGEAIGLVWGTFIESPHSLAIPYESLKRDIGIYFGR